MRALALCLVLSACDSPPRNLACEWWMTVARNDKDSGTCEPLITGEGAGAARIDVAKITVGDKPPVFIEAHGDMVTRPPSIADLVPRPPAAPTAEGSAAP